MDLKRKILSLILFFISIITLTIYINYQTHKNYYYELIEYSIDSIIDKVRFDIQKADRIVAQITNFKKDIYYTIHQKAHEELKANPHLDINKLKSKLLEYLPSSKFMDIHLYLINPHYIIYNTTYKIDLGLDMSNMKGAQEYIDSAFNEVDTIHFAIAPSFDIMTNEYRLYSYSAINEYIVLELGYFDQSLSSIKDQLYQFNLQDSIVKDIDIFIDYKTYIVNISKKHKRGFSSKDEYLKSLKSNRDTFVAKASNTKESYHYHSSENGRDYRICYRYVKSSKISKSKYKNYVVRAKVDVTNFNTKLHRLEVMLYGTIMISLILILILTLFFKRNILYPFKVILETLNSNQTIIDPTILTKKDEFGKISHNINTIQAQVNEKTKELQIVNHKLHELNNSLEQRVQDEVSKNCQKDQQLISQGRLAQMGEMIAMIAHQWRQPLSAINAIALNLQIKTQTNSVDKNLLMQSSQDINRYTLHLSETIDVFRDFFKSTTPKSETSFDEVISGVFKIIGGSLETYGIVVDQELKYHEKFEVIPNELKHILLNLIKNAKDAFIENSIKNRLITIKTYKEEDKKILEVSDNAGGIPEEIIDKIFDPYVTTKVKKDGTGLGLYLSKMIIEQHYNGTIEVSTQDKQTTFRVVF